MFERLVQWVTKHGARVLLTFVALILLVAVVQAIGTFASVYENRGAVTYAGRVLAGFLYAWPQMLMYLLGGLTSASWPFFGAVIIHRIDLWMQVRGTAMAADAAAPAPPRLVTFAVRLLIGLSCVYFLAGLLSIVNWVLQVHSVNHQILLSMLLSSLAPMWSGAILLSASLVLSRLDRWLATSRRS